MSQSTPTCPNNRDRGNLRRRRERRATYKFTVLSDRDTDLTKINPRMWWEQISEYMDITDHKNLEELMDQGREVLDAHSIYHIKGNVI